MFAMISKPFTSEYLGIVVNSYTTMYVADSIVFLLHDIVLTVRFRDLLRVDDYLF